MAAHNGRILNSVVHSQPGSQVKTDLSSSLTPIISEEDFLPLVQKECQTFLAVLRFLRNEKITVNKFYYFTLMQEAERLEAFLDDHAARANLRWLFFSELVACVRNFSLAGFHLLHVLDRYSDYLGGNRDSIRGDFEKESRDTLDYFPEVLGRFYEELLNEASNQGIEAREVSVPTEAWRVEATPHLPYTVYSDNSSDETERIISIAQSYRRTLKVFKQHRLHRKIKTKDLSKIIPSKLNERLMDELESYLHNIQSEYDTHIRGSKTEKSNQWVITLRGLTAIPMHLFEFLEWLVHFYERHERHGCVNEESGVKNRISELVDNDRLLACIVDFALYYCNRYLTEGNEVAERILSMYVDPITCKLPLPKPQGFHARPSTYVSLIVQEHGTDVFMSVGGKDFNCRSVLELIEAGGLLADMNAESALFKGDKRSLDDLRILAEHNYCEEEDIPAELGYLKILRNL